MICPNCQMNIKDDVTCDINDIASYGAIQLARVD